MNRLAKHETGYLKRKLNQRRERVRARLNVAVVRCRNRGYQIVWDEHGRIENPDNIGWLWNVDNLNLATQVLNEIYEAVGDIPILELVRDIQREDAIYQTERQSR